MLVVDFGAQYAQLIARRVRECHVYSEIVPHTITAQEIRDRAPKAVILSGGPSSVYEGGSASVALGWAVPAGQRYMGLVKFSDSTATLLGSSKVLVDNR